MASWILSAQAACVILAPPDGAPLARIGVDERDPTFRLTYIHSVTRTPVDGDYVQHILPTMLVMALGIGVRVKSARPIAISTSPGSSVPRAPKRVISGSAKRSDIVPITSVAGRKANPIWRGS